MHFEAVYTSSLILLLLPERGAHQAERKSREPASSRSAVQCLTNRVQHIHREDTDCYCSCMLEVIAPQCFCRSSGNNRQRRGRRRQRQRQRRPSDAKWPGVAEVTQVFRRRRASLKRRFLKNASPRVNFHPHSKSAVFCHLNAAIAIHSDLRFFVRIQHICTLTVILPLLWVESVRTIVDCNGAKSVVVCRQFGLNATTGTQSVPSSDNSQLPPSV